MGISYETIAFLYFLMWGLSFIKSKISMQNNELITEERKKDGSIGYGTAPDEIPRLTYKQMVEIESPRIGQAVVVGMRLFVYEHHKWLRTYVTENGVAGFEFPGVYEHEYKK